MFKWSFPNAVFNSNVNVSFNLLFMMPNLAMQSDARCFWTPSLIVSTKLQFHKFGESMIVVLYVRLTAAEREPHHDQEASCEGNPFERDLWFPSLKYCKLLGSQLEHPAGLARIRPIKQISKNFGAFIRACT